ncbi:nitronate monooxygenase [Chitinophaga sp. MD30]|nr:nitronate monooxygenase [Chitinophaga sp. MD30]
MWNNIVAEKLQVQYPLIQAPMLGITTPAMVAAVSNAGALGSLPIGGLAPSQAAALIQEVKRLTDKPFAVNLFAHPAPTPYTAEEVTQMQSLLHHIRQQHQLDITAINPDNVQYHYLADQIPVLLDEQVRIISFTFGIPDEESMHRLKTAGCLLIGTATSLAEASMLEAKGCDMIVAQGAEAGGHRGTFLDPMHPPMIGTMALVPQIFASVHIPVIAAGGIMDGRGVAAAFVLGAQGVQAGSAFLRCTESLATPAHKQAIADSYDTSSQLTRAFSGRWARGIRNEFIDTVHNAGITPLPYPVQDALTKPLRNEARKQDNIAWISLWAGQAAALAHNRSAAAVIEQMKMETEAIFRTAAEML